MKEEGKKAVGKTEKVYLPAEKRKDNGGNGQKRGTWRRNMLEKENGESIRIPQSHRPETGKTGM